MNTIVNERITMTLSEAGKAIVASPKIRYNLVGEPGSGKTSLAKTISEAVGMEYRILSCTNMDLGDICMPVIDHESKTTKYYPNATFGLHDGKPKVIILDEYSKAPQPVQNMLHPMLEVFNPRLGDMPTPEGTIVVLTGNLETDGVGDSMAAHTRQRVCTVEISKPNSDEWLQWAANNHINPIIMAWVDRNPHALASYRDGDQQENPFIFNPRKTQDGCVSPRTLELASRILDARDSYSFSMLQAALAGVVGRPAAESISQFVRHQDSLPTFQEIRENPNSALVPEDAGAVAVLVFGLIERVEKDTLEPIMTYLRRVDEEWQCLFGISLVRRADKQAIATTNRAFAQWLADNVDLL